MQTTNASRAALRVWTKPSLQRIGMIGDVAGQTGGATQQGGGGFKTPS